MPDRPDRLIVSNTGLPISLQKLSSGYDFIRLLYDRLLVPQTVMDELVQGEVETAGRYVERCSVGDLLDIRSVAKGVFIGMRSGLLRGVAYTYLRIFETSGRGQYFC